METVSTTVIRGVAMECVGPGVGAGLTPRMEAAPDSLFLASSMIETLHDDDVDDIPDLDILDAANDK